MCSFNCFSNAQAVLNVECDRFAIMLYGITVSLLYRLFFIGQLPVLQVTGLASVLFRFVAHLYVAVSSFHRSCFVLYDTVVTVSCFVQVRYTSCLCHCFFISQELFCSLLHCSDGVLFCSGSVHNLFALLFLLFHRRGCVIASLMASRFGTKMF